MRFGLTLRKWRRHIPFCMMMRLGLTLRKWRRPYLSVLWGDSGSRSASGVGPYLSKKLKARLRWPSLESLAYCRGSRFRARTTQGNPLCLLVLLIACSNCFLACVCGLSVRRFQRGSTTGFMSVVDSANYRSTSTRGTLSDLAVEARRGRSLSPGLPPHPQSSTCVHDHPLQALAPRLPVVYI